MVDERADLAIALLFALRALPLLFLAVQGALKLPWSHGALPQSTKAGGLSLSLARSAQGALQVIGGVVRST